VPLGIYTGRSPFMRSAAKPAPAPVPAPPPAPAPAPAPAPPPKTTCSDPTWGLIKMSKTMPPEVSLGGEFMAELHLTAQACAANVVVHDTVPANASYVRSEPAATVSGNQLTWQIGDLESGESRDIKLWLKAEKEGTIVNCASVSADPRNPVDQAGAGGSGHLRSDSDDPDGQEHREQPIDRRKSQRSLTRRLDQ